MMLLQIMKIGDRNDRPINLPIPFTYTVSVDVVNDPVGFTVLDLLSNFVEYSFNFLAEAINEGSIFNLKLNPELFHD
ncbi:MAG: hypothetical protein VKL42_08910 [Snowella sp.]|nr:hypothetical protein [Snowella sp.]